MFISDSLLQFCGFLFYSRKHWNAKGEDYWLQAWLANLSEFVFQESSFTNFDAKIINAWKFVAVSLREGGDMLPWPKLCGSQSHCLDVQGHQEALAPGPNRSYTEGIDAISS